jgi:hypothetical protein
MFDLVSALLGFFIVVLNAKYICVFKTTSFNYKKLFAKSISLISKDQTHCLSLSLFHPRNIF